MYRKERDKISECWRLGVRGWIFKEEGEIEGGGFERYFWSMIDKIG